MFDIQIILCAIPCMFSTFLFGIVLYGNYTRTITVYAIMVAIDIIYIFTFIYNAKN